MTTRVLALGLFVAVAVACGGDDDGGLLRRPIDTIGGNEVGSTCAVDEDCGDPTNGAECCTGGKCGPDGWCSPRCDTDRDCPDGYVCVDHDGSRCFYTCETDRDCPADFVCEEKDSRLSCRYKEEAL